MSLFKHDRGRKVFEKERRRKDGQEKHLGANPIFLLGIWLAWTAAMSWFWCYFVIIIRAVNQWLTSPQLSEFIQQGDPSKANTAILAQAIRLTNLGDYQVRLEAPLLYWGGLAVLSTAAIPLVIRMYIRWKPRRHNQYGNDRLTTEKEIQKQYPQIPDREFEFAGYGGIPVSHTTPLGLMKNHPLQFSSNYLLPKVKQWSRALPIESMRKQSVRRSVTGFYSIDQTTVNNLVIGISRSGKGETLIMPFVDILSRAQQKASMVLNDPKGELYQMSYKTLRRRGYNVQVLNIQDTDYSMSYNPLEKIIEYAKDGYYDEVQDAVNSLSSSIYVDPNAKDKFWQNSSINLLNSLILAVLDHAKRNQAWEEVTMDNVLHMMTELGSKQVMVDEKGDIIEGNAQNPNAQQRNKLLVYFDKLRDLNSKDYGPLRQMALDAFAQSKFAGEETSGNIYSSAMEGIKIYQQSNIAKLTSLNSVDFESLGFPRRLKLNFPAERYRFKVMTIEFLDKQKSLEKRTFHADKLGIVNCPIKTKLPENFTIKVSFDTYQNDNNLRKEGVVITGRKVWAKKGIGRGNYIRDPYTGKKVLKRINLKITENSLESKPEITMSYSEAPVALFLVTPPNNPSYNQLPAFAVDQIFNSLWKASSEVGRKVFTRVHFILDEFGNMPTIREMSQKVSIGLGAGLLFTLVVQNLEQLEINYSKDQAATIQSNCQNLLYILTNSKATAEQISFQIGKRTVNVASVNGQVGSWNGANVNNNLISQDIISAKELTDLMGGEMVVLRSVYRQDQKGNSVSAMPIFDHGRTIMPFRNTFLKEEFDDRTTLADIGIQAPHRYFDLKKNRIDYDKAYNQLIDLMNKQDDLADRNKMEGHAAVPEVSVNQPTYARAEEPELEEERDQMVGDLMDQIDDDDYIFPKGDPDMFFQLYGNYVGQQKLAEFEKSTVSLVNGYLQRASQLASLKDDSSPDMVWNEIKTWPQLEELFHGNTQVYRACRAALQKKIEEAHAVIK